MKTCTHLLIWLLPAVAAAQTRSSAGYSITTEVADRGGGRATSAAYNNDGSVGGIGGISTVATPAGSARHGYAGQLYEVTALQIAATPATVNEGATRQLNAAQLLDDTTTLAVPAAIVTWNVQSGPVSSISASGLATAAPVLQDTIAVVTGSYAGLAGTLDIGVLSVNHDNYGAFAGDGLPDYWQNQYFASTDTNAGPDRDPDGDGQNNHFEYTAGLNPVSAASRFLLEVQSVPGQPNWKYLVFSPRMADSLYNVEVWDPGLNQWFMLTGAPFTDAGTVRTVTDRNATGARRIYRVKIQKP